MVFDHIGIINKNEDEAVRFYRDLLGLKKIKESTVTSALSSRLFSLEREIKMLVFEVENIRIEIFIMPDFRPQLPNIPHFSLRVRDFKGFLERIGRAGVRVISGLRNDRTVYFIEDFSENRIEIKPL
ncbi:MAG: VOC family protein [Nitrospirota bacterium]